jgi:hypothetical protein
MCASIGITISPEGTTNSTSPFSDSAARARIASSLSIAARGEPLTSIRMNSCTDGNRIEPSERVTLAPRCRRRSLARQARFHCQGRTALPARLLPHVRIVGRRSPPVSGNRGRDRSAPKRRPQGVPLARECATSRVGRPRGPEIHERELAGHDVETRISKGRGRIASSPCYVRLTSRRDRQHPLIKIKANDLALLPDPPEGLACEHAGPAANVEDLVTPPDSSGVSNRASRNAG